MYPAELLPNFINGQICLLFSNFYILLLTYLAYYVQVTISCVFLLVVDVAHHFVSYVADALQVLWGAPDVGESEVKWVLVELHIAILLEELCGTEMAFIDC